MTEEKTAENIPIVGRNEQFQEKIDLNEAELGVPEEKNEARQLNIGNVFMIVIVAIVLIFSIILMFTKPKQRKTKKEEDLDKVSSKVIPKFPSMESKKESLIENNFIESEPKKKDVDEILTNLPPEFQRQPEPSSAPISSPDSNRNSYSSGISRPDTRNSRSPRKVDGLAGHNYVAPSNNNQNIVSAMMNGNGYNQTQYQPQHEYGNGLSKEEYIEQMLSRMTSVNGTAASYANPNMPQIQQYQSNKEAFFSKESGSAGKGQYLSYASLWEGTIISGSLETAINTDNPGVVIARVTENVYSSYDGSLLLIPEGSLLYATYNSSVSYGQDRVQIAWNLLIRPDGYRMQLGNMNGVDPQGASGTKGHVTNHPFATMKALGLVAVFSVIQTEINGQIKSSNNQYVQNAMADTYSEASKIGNKILDKALDIKPTITIKQGTKIKLITNATLDLPPVKNFPVTRKYVRTR